MSRENTSDWSRVPSERLPRLPQELREQADSLYDITSSNESTSAEIASAFFDLGNLFFEAGMDREQTWQKTDNGPDPYEYLEGAKHYFRMSLQVWKAALANPSQRPLRQFSATDYKRMCGEEFAKAAIQLGTVHTHLWRRRRPEGDEERASYHFFEAMLNSELAKNPKVRVSADINFGILLRLQRHYAEANNLFQEAFALSQDENDFRGMMFALGNQAELFLEQRNFPEAEKCIRAAMEYALRAHDPAGLRFVLDVGAHIFEEQSRLGEALKWVESFLEVEVQLGRQNTHTHALARQFEHYIRRKIAETN